MREYRKNSVMIEPAALFFLALMLLIFPLQWVAGLLVAIAIHEMGHYLAIRLLGGRIHSIRIGVWGMVMETSSLSWMEEFAAALAGPVCGLVLMLLCRKVPEIAICAGIQSVYNLLPVYPLDGGRALRSLLYQLLPGDQAEKGSKLAQTVFCIILFFCVLMICAVLRLRLVLLLLMIWLWIRVIRKRPCKPKRKRLQ